MGKQIQTHNGKQYIYERGVHYWTPKDLNRLIATMRNSGRYKDEDIARAVVDSFGAINYVCGYVQIVNWLKTSLLIGAIYGLLKALKTILKGWKILKTSIIAKEIEWSVWLLSMTGNAAQAQFIGKFFIWTGVIETMLSLMILYIQAFLDSGDIIDFAGKVCAVEGYSYTVYQPLQFAGLDDVALRIYEEQQKLDAQIKATGDVEEIQSSNDLFPDA